MARTTRRTFIKSIAYSGAALPLIAPKLIRADSPNGKLGVAFIGTGGRALGHVGEMYKMGQNCIAFAEVDKTRWNPNLAKDVSFRDHWPSAVGYTDWRKVFENHAKEIDVVFVATPDHTHFAPSMTAVSLGKHCYTEKPLTWSVRESQLLAEAYRKNPKVVTQMGNQGHGDMGWRRAHAYIAKGILGDITEFHTWTNRPIWPQGYGRPSGHDPVPEHLDWDAWIGPAAMRPYVGSWKEGPFASSKWKEQVYHPFAWRGVLDFGAGALGDMACHTTDGIHAIMEPDYPTRVEPVAQSGDLSDQFALGSIIKWQYPAKGGRPAFTAFWYEGYKSMQGLLTGDEKDAYKPTPPEELVKEGRELPRTGNLVVGTKGKMLVTGDYWNSPRLIPESFAQEVGRVDPVLEPSPGHHAEFIMACKGDKPREFSQSNWGYSGPMTAKILLGNVAVKVGRKLEIGRDGRITNIKEANDLLWREPRKGWGPLETIV
jgi:predicted dehydrogenase